MEALLAWIARGLVDEPDAVRVERTDEGDTVVLRLFVAPDDVGKVIGRHGESASRQRRRGRSDSSWSRHASASCELPSGERPFRL
jgi:predicted RNA-binding protein YlqC (UPF0109 family)